MSVAVRWPALPELLHQLPGLMAGTTQSTGNPAAAGGWGQPHRKGNGPGEPGAWPQQLCIPRGPVARPDRRRARAWSCGVSKLCLCVPVADFCGGCACSPSRPDSPGAHSLLWIQKSLSGTGFLWCRFESHGQEAGQSQGPDASLFGKEVRGCVGRDSEACQAANPCRCFVKVIDALKIALVSEWGSHGKAVFGSLSSGKARSCAEPGDVLPAAAGRPGRPSQGTLPAALTKHPDSIQASRPGLQAPQPVLGASQLSQHQPCLQAWWSRLVSRLTSEEVRFLSLIPESCQLEEMLGLGQGPRGLGCLVHGVQARHRVPGPGWALGTSRPSHGWTLSSSWWSVIFSYECSEQWGSPPGQVWSLMFITKQPSSWLPCGRQTAELAWRGLRNSTACSLMAGVLGLNHTLITWLPAQSLNIKM